MILMVKLFLKLEPLNPVKYNTKDYDLSNRIGQRIAESEAENKLNEKKKKINEKLKKYLEISNNNCLIFIVIVEVIILILVIFTI